MLFDPGACCSCSTAPVCRLRFRVFGCNLQPLSGALVEVSKDAFATIAASGSTDAAGEVEIDAGSTGSYQARTTHPSGRFNTATTFVTQGCGSANYNMVNLSARAGYACCGVRANPGDPAPALPIPTSLKLITSKGTFDVTVSSCAISRSVRHEAPDVADTATMVSAGCSAPYAGAMPPDIGLKETNVSYNLSLGAAPTARETTYLAQSGGQLWNYTNPFCVNPFDQNDPPREGVGRTWRVSSFVSNPNAWSSESYTLVSLDPFHLVFDMESGPGFGPFPLDSIPPKIGDSISKTLILVEPGHEEEGEGLEPPASIWIPPSTEAGLEDSPPPSYPPLAKQAANLLGSAARFVASGGATVDQAEYDRRRAICQSCPSKRYVVVEDRCEACGCWLAVKPWGKAEACPDGHW